MELETDGEKETEGEREIERGSEMGVGSVLRTFGVQPTECLWRGWGGEGGEGREKCTSLKLSRFLAQFVVEPRQHLNRMRRGLSLKPGKTGPGGIWAEG